MKPIKILSLFDGISCGRIALERAGIPVEIYQAWEIEESAIKISQANYPDIVHNGDVTTADFTRFQDYDLLMGGSPCTNWSCAKNYKAKTPKENFINEGIGWELFKQYVRALKEAKPKYFLYENNYRISQNIIENITLELGVEPILINSALVSAQNRKRLYWTNIPNVTQPKDLGILLKDIYVPDSSLVKTDPRILNTAIETSNYVKYDLLQKGHWSQQDRLYYLDGKSPTIPKSRTKTKCNILLNKDDLSTYKTISVLEAERLQTLLDNYTKVKGVTETEQFSAIGNGWTVDVIAHILKFISRKEEE